MITALLSMFLLLSQPPPATDASTVAPPAPVADTVPPLNI